jgi:hypothetical protein
MGSESTGGAMNTPVERFRCSTHVHKLHRGVIEMHSFFSIKWRCFLAVFSLLAGFTLAVSAQAPATATEDLNTLAHRILNTGIVTSSLKAEGLKPWHMKADLQLTQPGKSKPDSASLEVWSMGPYQWKRVYTGKDRHYYGSEWSVSRFEQYRTKPDDGGFDPSTLNRHAARPVIDPLYLAGNIQPNYEMTIKSASQDGVALKCVLVANPSDYNVDQTNPVSLFPTVCFDSDMHLRVVSSSDAAVKYDDIQSFQNRSVARDVKVVVRGAQVAEIKVTLLEEWTGADAAQLKPGKGTVAEPYRIEPGMPQPESVYEVGFPPPTKNGGQFGGGSLYYSGMITVPILIKKDGSVKVITKEMMADDRVKDAAEDAINHWKYKPYLVDGQPVEVGFMVHYDLDKPFVPSYKSPKVKPAAAAPKQ